MPKVYVTQTPSPVFVWEIAKPSLLHWLDPLQSLFFCPWARLRIFFDAISCFFTGSKEMTSTSRVKIITTYSQFEGALADSNVLVCVNLLVQYSCTCTRMSLFFSIDYRLAKQVTILYTVPGCPHCNRFLPAFNALSTESWDRPCPAALVTLVLLLD